MELENLPVMMKKTMSYEDRDEFQKLINAQSPSRTVLSQLRKNYSANALAEQVMEVEAREVWIHLRDEAAATVANDKFMEEYLTAKLLKFKSFSEALIVVSSTLYLGPSDSKSL